TAATGLGVPGDRASCAGRTAMLSGAVIMPGLAGRALSPGTTPRSPPGCAVAVHAFFADSQVRTDSAGIVTGGRPGPGHSASAPTAVPSGGGKAPPPSPAAGRAPPRAYTPPEKAPLRSGASTWP